MSQGNNVARIFMLGHVNCSFETAVGDPTVSNK